MGAIIKRARKRGEGKVGEIKMRYEIIEGTERGEGGEDGKSRGRER